MNVLLIPAAGESDVQLFSWVSQCLWQHLAPHMIPGVCQTRLEIHESLTGQ